MTPRRRIPPVVEPQTAIPMQAATSQGEVVKHDEPTIIEAPSAPPTMPYPPKMAAAILKVMKALRPVAKAGENTFHKYRYPKWEDVLDELGPKMTDAGLIVMQDEVSTQGLKDDMIAMTYQFTIISEDGEVWPKQPHLTAICKVRDQKGVLDDKAGSKCHTQAQKYFHTQLLRIRTRDMDEADHDNDGTGNHRNRRMVPNSNGRYPPHAVAVNASDTALSWAERLVGFITKTESVDELELWDRENSGTIDRIQKRATNADLTAAERTDATTAYNKIVEAFEDRQKALTPKVESKPAAQPAPEITAEERDWLEGLRGAFSGCEDMESLEAEAKRLMDPQSGKVSTAAWNEADNIWRDEEMRIKHQ